MKSSTTLLASLKAWLLALLFVLLAVGTIGFVIYVRGAFDRDLVRSVIALAPLTDAQQHQVQAAVVAQSNRLVTLHFIVMASMFGAVAAALILLLRDRLSRPL